MTKNKYQINYLQLFYDDLDKIIDYIINKLKNPLAAENLLNKIEKEIIKRAYNPENYQKYKSTRKRKDTYYRIYVNNYIIFYIVKDNIMQVRRILYNKRNFKNLI